MCKILHIERDNPRDEYFMQGTKIEEAEEEKNLGVWVNTTLKLSKQCATAAKAANFAWEQMLRAFHFRTKRNMILSFETSDFAAFL